MASGDEHNLPTNAVETTKKNRRRKAKTKEYSLAADVADNFSSFPEDAGYTAAQNRCDKKMELADLGIEALNARLRVVEDNLEALKKYLLDQIEAIKGSVTNVKQDVETIKNNVVELVNAEDIRKREFYASESKLMDVVNAIQDKVVAIEKKISADKKLDVPKPKNFKGVRDAQEVENFIWRLEEYFEHLDISEDKDKIRQASMYLTDTAMLWWRWKKNAIGKGTCKIDTWDKFKTEFKRKFYPTNAAYEARKKLRDLKQTGTVQDYIKDFTTLALQIPKLSPEFLLFYFLDGLQHWAKQELLIRKVADIDEAIVVAESLIDYKADKQKKHSKYKQAKGGMEQQKHSYKKKEAVQSGPEGGCLACKGPHFCRDCPVLGSIKAMLQQKKKQQEEQQGAQGETNAQLGSLQLCGAAHRQHNQLAGKEMCRFQ